MSYPCLIWADPRTGSSALFYALSKIIGTSALYEPFQYDGADGPAIWTHIYQDWCEDGDPAALYEAIGDHYLIKHIPEAFDDNFNADLARAAEYHGYRHIRLHRCDTFSRLVSRGLAEQLDAWYGLIGDITVGDLQPLDLEHLIATAYLDAARWQAITPWLTAVLRVQTEDMTSAYAAHRRSCLRRILRFLELPPEGLGELDESLAQGRQNTTQIAKFVPNLNELRQALITAGVA